MGTVTSLFCDIPDSGLLRAQTAKARPEGQGQSEGHTMCGHITLPHCHKGEMTGWGWQVPGKASALHSLAEPPPKDT